MGEQLVWLDLCSGLGGASQPALDRGWRVIRVDIDPRFKPDIVADVRALPLKPFPIDVLWASPDCREFSREALPWFIGKYQSPSMELVYSCLKVVRDFNPPWWMIENVRNARKYLTPVLGPVRYYSTGHVLWGNLPTLLPNIAPHKGPWGTRNGSGGIREQRKDRGGAEAAKIPYEIGEAICAAVERRRDDL
jgi:hypothetical protein